MAAAAMKERRLTLSSRQRRRDAAASGSPLESSFCNGSHNRMARP